MFYNRFEEVFFFYEINIYYSIPTQSSNLITVIIFIIVQRKA